MALEIKLKLELGRATRSARTDYGIDAPGVQRGMLGVGMGGLAVALLLAAVPRRRGALGNALVGLTGLASVGAAYGFTMGGYMTYSAKVGKLRARDRLLNAAGRLRPWSGRERVLDVGCGRGLMLIGAACRLTTGQAVGVDIWRTEDQAGVSAEAALENARLEGVADRVRVQTMDACALTFEDESFDAVLSHWVVHNLRSPADRRRSLEEMVRVLKPGGVLLLADIKDQSTYRAILVGLGLVDLVEDDGGLESRVIGALSGGSFRPRALIGLRPWLS